MNGPDEPSTDDRIEQLLDAIDAVGPFGSEVEDHLHPSGPVSVDDDEAGEVVTSLLARFAAEREARGQVEPADGSTAVPPPSSEAPTRRTTWQAAALVLAAASVLLVVASLSWQAGLRAATEGAGAALVDPEVHDLRYGEVEVALSPMADAQVGEDTIVLVDGVASIARTDPRQVGPHRVDVSLMNLHVEPMGTVYSVGVHGDLAAVWVREGRVRLLHDTEGHLGEITAGNWALLAAGGPALELHRVPDGPFDPTEIGLAPSATQLLADMRWLALPEGSREAILEPLDAPAPHVDDR